MRINYLLKVLVTTALVVAVPTFPTAQTKIVSPDSRTNFSVWGVPQNMGTAVNSIDNESAAAVSPNGLSLYVSSNKSGSIGSIDIWVSQRPTLSSAWGTVQNLGQPVNSSSNENLPVLSADGTTMFFNCSCPDQFGGADIYMTTRTDPNNDAGWRTPVNLGPVINTPDAEWGAGYFEDPTNGTAVLYFTSDRAGGLGANDIYQSTRNADGTFNPPTNVTELNSSSFERNATVSHDGLEIYLTSDRDGGLGDRDIWVSTRASISSPWNPPVNAASVNSAASDQSPALSADGSVLYFSSGRDGSPDIYAATRISVNRTPTADFDGDGRTDLSVFRPSDGTWHILQSGTNTYRIQSFGLNGDKVTPGDYDGDGRIDLAVFRPSTATWWILRSSDGSFSTSQFGLATDKPVPGDYDGDGRTDTAVYRSGTWYVLQTSNGQVAIQQFGLSSDIPIAAIGQ